jgi:hypothetical protein
MVAPIKKILESKKKEKKINRTCNHECTAALENIQDLTIINMHPSILIECILSKVNRLI